MVSGRVTGILNLTLGIYVYRHRIITVELCDYFTEPLRVC